MNEHRPVPAEALRRRCDPSELHFETTAELTDLDTLPGQARAIEAIDFGVGIQGPGYNLYVAGPTGMGKHTLVRSVLEGRASGEGAPSDWVYVHGFEEARKPVALSLPAGRGATLVDDAEALIREVRSAIPAAFETDEIRNRRRVIEREVEDRNEATFGALNQKAKERGLALLRTPAGFALAPVRDGEVLPPNRFEALPEAERKKLQDDVSALESELQEILRQVPRWGKEAREKLLQLEGEVVSYAIDHLIDDLKQKYADLDAVHDWLGRLRDDLVEHAPELVRPKQSEETKLLSRLTGDADPWTTRYRVNLLVDRRGAIGAPVVEEPHPNLENLLGSVEHRQQLGALTSDFTLIKAGALHRANGGYLILDARRVLAQPAAWEALKRTLRTGFIRIESLGQALGLASTVTLEPAPIPLDVKVILVGERLLYYRLCQYDPEMGQLFKVQADFEDDTPRSDESVPRFAALIGTMARRANLLPFDRTAVARLVEEGARLAADAHKLTTHVEAVADLLRESSWFAGRRRADRVTETDVEAARQAQERRADRIREREHQSVEEGTLHIATTGSAVGAINGLSVLSLGTFRFGRPTRITARVRLGKGELVDIEREVQLGGPLHSKGVLILGALLGARYAAERPLSLRASLVFEQSYGGIDGDSASMAELCALLSALAEIPIRQNFAITGSVDQMGTAQAIGGVNEKIEGFFDVCRRTGAGLDGTQGVLIPASNQRHLMLRSDVVRAAGEGRFRVFAYRDVDEAIEVLTGVTAGVPGAEGRYPEGSVNRRVADRLIALSEVVKRLARESRGGSGNDDPTPETPGEPVAGDQGGSAR